MTDTCPATNRNGEPCGLSAGWGTDNDSGPCKFHGGAGGDVGDPGGAPKGNGNAVTHGAYGDPVNLYRHLGDDEREWVDAMVDAYLSIASFDEDDPRAERLQMTCVIMYQEWAAREVVLRDGMSEDATIGVSDAGAPIVRTDEHHLTGTAGRHNQTVRMNLKDLGFLDDPQSQQADAVGSLAEVLSRSS